MNVRNFINAIGGAPYVAKKLGFRHNTTVYGWIYKNKIPAWRKDCLRKIAKSKKINFEDYEKGVNRKD